MNAIRIIKRLGILAVIGLLGCHRDNMAPTGDLPGPRVDADKATVSFTTNAPELASITVQTAQPRTLAVTHVTGRLYWDDDVTVRIFTPMAGRVIAVPAHLGQAVSVGTPLAEIDSPDFGQVLANARTAMGNLAVAEKAYARSQELLQHGAAAQKDVEAAEAAHVAALAERDRAAAVLANYGGKGKNTNGFYILRSPLAGVLVEKNISPGQELRADLMLANAPNLFAPNFVVSDPTRLWLQLDVAESDLASLHPGQRLQVFSHAFPGKVFTGKLENIGDSLDPSTHAIKARGLVNNPDNLLKAEMYVTVDVAQATNAAPAGVEIPVQAIFLNGDKHYVFVQDRPGEFRRQEVTPDAETQGRALILSGLSSGQSVVTDGCVLLQQLLE